MKVHTAKRKFLMLRSLVIIATAFNTNRSAFGRCVFTNPKASRRHCVVVGCDIIPLYHNGWLEQDSRSIGSNLACIHPLHQECISGKIYSGVFHKKARYHKTTWFRPTTQKVPSINGSASGSIQSPSRTALKGCVTVKNNPILINRKNKLTAGNTKLHRQRGYRRRARFNGLLGLLHECTITCSTAWGPVVRNSASFDTEQK